MELTPEVIRQLIKKVGKQMKFLKRFEEFKKQNSPADFVDANFSVSEDEISGINASITNIVSVQHRATSSDSCSSGSTVYVDENGKLLEISEDETLLVPAKKLKCDINEENPVDNIYENYPTANMNLMEVITSDAVGSAVLNKYKKEKTLDGIGRSTITSLTVGKMLQISLQLRRSDFINAAKQIVKIFPTESPETYYIPSGTGCKFARGKLADKYRNKKHRLRKFGAILESSTSTPSLSEHVSDSYVEQSEDVMQSKVWLKHNVEPWEEVISKWKFTSSFRLPRLKSVQSLDLAFIEWPLFKHPNGHILISIDFSYLYPGKEYSLLNNWTKYLPRIRNEIAKNEQLKLPMDSHENIDENERDYQIFNSLHHICRPYFVVSNKKNKWRPTIIESQESMIMRIQSCDEIEERIERELEKQLKNCNGCQPFVIAVVGTSSQSLESFYTYVDGVRYKLPTLLAAVDLCFKAIQVFHLEYPVACKNTWWFVQKGLYGINTQWDRQSPEVSALITEICK
ncbi:hypothetical protein Avbf_12390 [Armadillidium vulgare]|nr:hypothetical protein Avbf_12390 [Armadillidium vulgare]